MAKKKSRIKKVVETVEGWGGHGPQSQKENRQEEGGQEVRSAKEDEEKN